MRPADEARRATRLRRWTALCGLVLVGATWRLWTPQDLYPQIPLFGFARTWPLWLDCVAFAGIAAAYAGLLLAPASSRSLAKAACGLLLASTALAVLLDQNRLQVWAYHFAILAVLLTVPGPRRAPTLVLWLTASIYVWSGVSKLDGFFVKDLGTKLLNEGLLAATGLNALLPGGFGASVVLLLPAYELLIGLAVATWRYRRLGLIASFAMHGLLLLALGPLGLDHSWGVLLWNVFFLGQDVILLQAELAWAAAEPKPAFTPRSDRLATALCVTVVLLPVLHPFGLLDPWLAWAVYDSSSPRVMLVYDDREMDNRGLDPPSGIYDDSGRENAWAQTLDGPRLLVGRWSIDALGVPHGPQERFQVGVVLSLMEAFPERDELWRSAWIYRPVDRWSGRWTHRDLLDREPTSPQDPAWSDVDRVRRHAETYRLNALPRVR